MDLDEFKESLSKKLDTPVFEASDQKEMAAVIRSKRRSVLRYFKLFMRIEILIFLWEIVDSVIEISKTDDNWSRGFEGVNILISATLIVVFLRIIKQIRDPFNRTLSVRENTEKVLRLMKRFYRYYFLLALLYSSSVVLYNIIGTLVRGRDFHAVSKRSLRLLEIADPLKRYIFFVGNELLFGVILFLVFWLLIWLFYGWRIRKLNKLLSDINH